MRIYKFRGFHADEHGKTVIKLKGKEIRGFWCYGDLHTDGPYINEHKVIPETVGQYVGVTDKNGKEIFEGNIVRYDNWIMRVLFNQTKLSFECKTRKGGTYPLCFYAMAQVVGNIFENPELLEVAE